MIAKITILIIASFCLGHHAVAEVEVPDDLKFVFRDEHYMNPEEKTAWHRQLHDTPNISDRLCDLLWACYRGAREDLGKVMGALMYRDDITPVQLKKITDEMRHLASIGMAEVTKLGVENLLYGIRILERYPSPENEDLALLLLNTEDPVLCTNAATTLGRIGTAKSVNPLQKFFDPFRNIKTEPPNDGNQVFEAEQLLLARVAAKSTLPTIQNGEGRPPKKPPGEESGKRTPTGDGESSSKPSSLVVVLIVAAICLLLLVFKNRK